VRAHEGRIHIDARRLLAELFGSFILLCLGGFAIASTATGIDGSVVVPLGFGLGLIVALYAFGEISGGHYNPAVSLAALLDKRIDAVTFVAYVAAQLVGFALAGFTILAATTKEITALTVTLPNEAAGVSSVDVVLLEALATALLVGVILRVTMSNTYGTTAFLAIGITVSALTISFGGLTGGSFNPGRSFGAALAAGNFSDFYLYLLGPFLGGVIGWVLYRITVPEEADANAGA
jgi:MIP family channel proteins